MENVKEDSGVGLEMVAEDSMELIDIDTEPTSPEDDKGRHTTFDVYVSTIYQFQGGRDEM